MYRITHATLAPLTCASSDATRHNLNGLRFLPDGSTYATDGHVLAYVPPLDEPQAPDSRGEDRSEELVPFILRPDEARQLQKAVGKRWAAEVDVEASNANGKLPATLPATGMALELPKELECDCPSLNWRAVVPKVDDTYTPVVLSVAVLEKIVEFARKATGTKKGDAVPLRFHVPLCQEVPDRAQWHTATDAPPMKVEDVPLRPLRIDVRGKHAPERADGDAKGEPAFIVAMPMRA